MESLEKRIENAIFFKPQGGIEEIFVVTRRELCHQTRNPLAYKRPHGDDAKSLKISSNLSGSNPFSIKYDGEKATVEIDWNQYHLTQAREEIEINITGNHDTNIRVFVQILCRLKSPVIELESKECMTVWGTETVSTIVVKGIVDGGHDSWRYFYQTKVFIKKTDGFFINGHHTETYGNNEGYILSLNQWERLCVPLKYDYGDSSISQPKEYSIPIIYIYYTTNSGHETIKKEVTDTFIVKFLPLKPSISLKASRLKSEYILGESNVNLFKIELSKSDIHAQDLIELNLISTDSRINVSIGNDSHYYVSLKKSSFRDLPEHNISIELKASASNAEDVRYNVIFTSGHIEDNNFILLKKANLIKVKETSEIQPNSSIILYSGVQYRAFKLCLVNVSSDILGAGNGMELKDVSLEIKSDFDVTFNKGKTKCKIESLQDTAFEVVEVLIQPTEMPSMKEFTIISSTGFSNSLVIPVKVETKAKLTPQIYFEFIQDGVLNYVDIDVLSPISYNNERIGTLIIKSVCDIDSVNYVTYSLIDNPIDLEDKLKYSISPCQEDVVLQPGGSLSFDVYLTGSVEQNEQLTVSSGTNKKEFSLSVSKQYYNIPDVKFYPVNGNYDIKYENLEKLLVGELRVSFSDNKNCLDVDCSISLLGSFCFEDGKTERIIDRNRHSIDIYLNSRSIFNGVENIKEAQQITLCVSMSSSVFKEETIDADLGMISVEPIIAEATPSASILFDNEPIDNEPAIVSFTSYWYNDIRNDVCCLLLKNATVTPYYPIADNKNDFVEFSNIRISVKGGHQVLGVGPVDVVRIENGGSPQSIPIYLKCSEWDKTTCAFDFEIRADIHTSRNHWLNEAICEDCFVLKEERNDKIYSLDLGTTGIVMAKQDNFEISTVHLQDDGESKSQHIEESDDIISSIAIVYEDALNSPESEVHQVLLSPRRTDYKNKASFIFVPSKFMVGQKRIPYIDQYLSEIKYVAFDPTLTSSAEIADENTIFALDANSDDAIMTPEVFLQLVYENILNRCQEKENIHKLILTYPNTYTQNVLDELRSLVSQMVSGAVGFVEMVPESDAVVAYYFNERVNYYGGDTSEAELRRIKVGTERVMIYDMGAGTLDLSLVSIVRQENDRHVLANIEKKIGIPIAGNYLDWVLYSGFFRDKVKDNEDKTFKNLKDYIKQIKQQYSACDLDKNIPIDNASDCLAQKYVGALSANNSSSETIKFKDLDSAIAGYLKLCSTTILDVFLGDNKIVDRLVFSGRGSQFSPLRTCVETYLREYNPKLVIDTTIDNCDLKTCVAKGALCYNDLFGADNDHTITNRNQHLNIGIVYIAPSADGSGNEICYQEIIHPDDNCWDEAILSDGTWWREFDNTVVVDLSVRNKKVFFIQTLLGPNRIKNLYRKVYEKPDNKRSDMDWVFVNELFSFNTNTLTQHDRVHIPVNVKIDKENNIDYRVGGRYPQGEKLVDKIEGNVFYQKGMWPYVVFND